MPNPCTAYVLPKPTPSEISQWYADSQASGTASPLLDCGHYQQQVDANHDVEECSFYWDGSPPDEGDLELIEALGETTDA